MSFPQINRRDYFPLVHLLLPLLLLSIGKTHSFSLTHFFSHFSSLERSPPFHPCHSKIHSSSTATWNPLLLILHTIAVTHSFLWVSFVYFFYLVFLVIWFLMCLCFWPSIWHVCPCIECLAVYSMILWVLDNCCLKTLYFFNVFWFLAVNISCLPVYEMFGYV